jgi:hypothetical protein
MRSNQFYKNQIEKKNYNQSLKIKILKSKIKKTNFIILIYNDLWLDLDFFLKL